ncbi:hypothetical protein I3842_05G152100 [Carya illinoinensis]|uniref:Uncharacterized protein n=1 Tax=Carya illinoinensis TaxID=32201 RepID=A0A922F047_CARIL|nr:hypothetical protein I3842_05G152100 [Carya illinoinensis]
MVREEVDLEKGQMAWDNAGPEKDLELCIRAKNNAWVIARITKGKELYMVLEKGNETVLYASDAVEKFSNRSILLLYNFVSFKKGKKNDLLRVFVHQFMGKCFIYLYSDPLQASDVLCRTGHTKQRKIN